MSRHLVSVIPSPHVAHCLCPVGRCRHGAVPWRSDRAAGEHDEEEAGTVTPELWVMLAVGIASALGPVGVALINRWRREPPPDHNPARRPSGPDRRRR
jgi:hypothetical protein